MSLNISRKLNSENKCTKIDKYRIPKESPRLQEK
jgi:hypothetical protein